MLPRKNKRVWSTALVTAFAIGIGGWLVSTAESGSAAAANTSVSIDPAIRDRALAQEQQVADCMHALGLTYVVAVPNDVYLDQAYTDAVAAGKQGAELHDLLAQVAAGLPADPNETVVTALPADQQATWTFALVGNDADPGCADRANTMSASDAGALDIATTAAERVKAAAAADPTVRAALTTYISCMSGRGYTVGDTEQIFNLVETQAEAIEPPDSAWPDPLPATATELQKAAYAAQVNRLEAKVQQAADIVSAGNAAHDACVAPYRQAFDAAYDRLAP
ncbi:hypothetical protein ACPPVO_58835 [Dactylosporangium sp. McL0621]|uniref:hypothetical protein n=1 Tax=Dactylosporangium sp. McL0621 TaxID=3415678 RepID=UPI003CE681D3